jgi:hypothetical protein
MMKATKAQKIVLKKLANGASLTSEYRYVWMHTPQRETVSRPTFDALRDAGLIETVGRSENTAQAFWGLTEVGREQL